MSALQSVTIPTSKGNFTVTMDQVVKFAPVVYFHGLEKYMPCSIEYLLPQAVLHDRIEIFPHPTQQTLYNYHGTARDPKVYLDLTKSSTTGSFPPPMYVSVQVPWHQKFVDLNFYFLFGFNGNQCVHVDFGTGAFDCSIPTFANHQGDIEGITVRVDPTLTTPVWVRYEAHGNSVFYPAADITWWTDPNNVVTTNPVVYSALYSHATFSGAGPDETGNYVVSDQFTSALLFSDYIRPTRTTPWVPFKRTDGQSVPNGTTIFVGLDGNGEPVGDQIWAKYAGYIGKTLHNLFDSELGVQPIGQALTPNQLAFANGLAGQYSRWGKKDSDRFVGEGPAGLAAKSSIKMNHPCWVPWMGKAVMSPYTALTHYPGPLANAPALVMAGEVLLMVFPQADPSETLGFAHYQHGKWSGLQTISLGVSAIQTPVLAVLDKLVYMLYTDQWGNLYWATLDFITNPDPASWTWVNQGAISGWQTSAPPSLALFNGALYTVYVGSGENGAMYWGSYDGTSWNDQGSILSKGLTSYYGPALAAYGQTLYLIYKGQGGDTIYFATYSPGTGWVNPAKNTIVGQTTSAGPSLIVADGTLFLIYLSNGSDNTIYYTFLENAGTWWFEAQKTRAGPKSHDLTTTTPAITSAGGVKGVLFYMAYLDNDGSGNIWLNTCSGAGA
jgi:hypothetical protein